MRFDLSPKIGVNRWRRIVLKKRSKILSSSFSPFAIGRAQPVEKNMERNLPSTSLPDYRRFQIQNGNSYLRLESYRWTKKNLHGRMTERRYTEIGIAPSTYPSVVQQDSTLKKSISKDKTAEWYRYHGSFMNILPVCPSSGCTSLRLKRIRPGPHVSPNKLQTVRILSNNIYVLS